jgi:flagellar motility protein MotE (MotC chaperone)
MPRILPLVGVAVGGVLAINALAGARDLPGLLSGAKAFAEEAAKPAPKKGAAKKPAAAKAAAAITDAKAGDGEGSLFADPAHPGAPDAGAASAAGAGKDAAASSALPPPSQQPRAVCAPTAAELAKEAGLSPAELQILQNLGARRGQLDQREQDLSTQVALLAAAEAKLDAKTKVLQGLKTDIQNLLAQADGKEQTEIDRLVKVFEGMKPKDAAARMAILDDSVRLPIAAKMKERSLSGIVGQMPPAEAKKLTEALAKRFTPAQILAQGADAKADAAAAATKTAADDPTKAAPPAKKARSARKAPAKKKPAAEGDDAQATAAADKSPPAAAPTPAKAG